MVGSVFERRLYMISYPINDDDFFKISPPFIFSEEATKEIS